MSTRGVIALGTVEAWHGRYHHWDSYPSGLGATLWYLRTERFAGDPQRLVEILLYEHPAGWSTINDANWDLEPGWAMGAAPACYCHGERHEEGQLISDSDDCGAEWAYVISEDLDSMTVLERAFDDGTPALGFFGLPAGGGWVPVTTLRFDGPEPNWEALDQGTLIQGEHESTHTEA